MGRYNRMIARLAEGRPVFGLFADNKSPEGAMEVARNDRVDFVFYDMEHSPLDFTAYRTYLQFMIDPAVERRRAAPGTEHPVLVRIPAYGREMNHWMIKQALDQGACGVIVPHVETPEQALSIVRAMRYPHPPSAPDAEPVGQRGAGAAMGARLWGMSGGDYLRAADLWPLDPDGELVSMLLIENQQGVAHARAIAKTPGVTIIVAAPGDLGVSYAGDRDAVERALQAILDAATEAGIPCGTTVPAADIPRRLAQGFRVIITDREGIAAAATVAK